MTLRARLAVLTSVAVALAVVAASIAAWLLIRSTLMDDVDETLLGRAPDSDQIVRLTDQFAETDASETDGSGRVFRSPDDGRSGDGSALILAMQNEPVGVQLIEPDGDVDRRVPPGDVAFEVSSGERELLDGVTDEPQLRTETVDGISYRIMSAVTGDGSVMRLVQPLTDVEETMSRIRWLLVGIAAVGAVAAGGVGWVIARAGLRPVDRLTRAAERVAMTNDLTHRIDVRGSKRGEVVRLARSINAMLAALDDAQKTQRQLVEDAAHELRTPLTTLRNDVGLLLRAEQHPERTLDEADREDVLRGLETEASALADLVGEIVELARGESEPEPYEEIDLRCLVERAVDRSSRAHPQVNVVVRGEHVELPARPAMLERAVVNLVRNAVQVSQERGQVEVVVGRPDDEVTVSVLDRGPGISDEDLPRLFDRFYRGADARARHGSGLGLAIVAQAAEQHGGTVDVRNRDGGGAVFTLRLPVGVDRADGFSGTS